MILPFDNNWRINSNSNEWLVQKNKSPLKPDPRWVSVGFYSSLEGALRGLSQRLIRESEVIGVVEAIRAVESLGIALAKQFNVKVTVGE